MAEDGEMRVLVVDDDEHFAALVTRELLRVGSVARYATDAAAAVRVAADLEPHVAILDLHLGGADGHALGLRLRAASRHDLQLVLLTGDRTVRVEDRSSTCGFAAHLVKPAAMRDVIRMVRVVGPRARRTPRPRDPG